MISNRCQGCPRGTYGNKTKLESKDLCMNCTAGRFNDGDGLAKEVDRVACAVCVAGKYSKEEGNKKDSKCKNCNSGKWSETKAAASVDDCKVCGVGRYSDNVGVSNEDSCESCPLGYEQKIEGESTGKRRTLRKSRARLGARLTSTGSRAPWPSTLAFLGSK